jgi:hypothetical protein
VRPAADREAATVRRCKRTELNRSFGIASAPHG